MLPPALATRLALAAAAVALLTAQAPILPMPNATPTPMARPGQRQTKPPPGTSAPHAGKPKPGAGKAKPNPKLTAGANGKPGTNVKPGARPGPQGKSGAKGPAAAKPSASTKPGSFPAAAPSFATFPAAVPSGKSVPGSGGKFPAAVPTTMGGKGVPSTGHARYHGSGSPPPTPTPPPPKAMGGPWVLVNWGGLSASNKTLRYGESLKLRQARGYREPIQLLVVNPGTHEDPYGARTIARFPGKLNHAQKEAYLGDVGHYKHLHWVTARGPELNLLPEAFLRLNEDVYGNAETLWPLRFVFYVVVAPRGRNREVYYKLVVTVTR